LCLYCCRAEQISRYLAKSPVSCSLLEIINWQHYRKAFKFITSHIKSSPIIAVNNKIQFVNVSSQLRCVENQSSTRVWVLSVTLKIGELVMKMVVESTLKFKFRVIDGIFKMS